MDSLPKRNTDEIWLRIKSLNTGRHGEQKELMDFCGIPANTYNSWASGVSRSYMKYLGRIALFYNVSVSWLLNGDEEFFSQKTSEKMCTEIVKFWESGKKPAINLFVPSDIERAIRNKTYRFSNITYPQFGKMIGIPMDCYKEDEKTPSTEVESVQYTDMELLEAFRGADERTREAIRTLLGIKEDK